MVRFHFILRLLFAIIAAQAELLYPDILPSSALLAPDQSELGKDFDDLFQQPFDASSDVDIGLLGSWDYGTNDPVLFAADVFNDKCFSSFLSPLVVGKARRRRNNNPEVCSSGAEFPEGGIPNLSPDAVEGKLAKPGEFEQNSCTGGGYLHAIAFLVCSSLSGSDVRSASFGGFAFTLYHSTRVLSPTDVANCWGPGGLYCCDAWVPNPIYVFEPDGTGTGCVPLEYSQSPNSIPPQ